MQLVRGEHFVSSKSEHCFDAKDVDELQVVQLEQTEFVDVEQLVLMYWPPEHVKQDEHARSEVDVLALDSY